MNTRGFEHCGEKGVFVFAIAILILENFRGRVGLVARETERKADIANIFGDVIVKGLNFVEFGSAALN